MFLEGIEKPPGGVLRKFPSANMAEITANIYLVGICELADTVCQVCQRSVLNLRPAVQPCLNLLPISQRHPLYLHIFLQNLPTPVHSTGRHSVNSSILTRVACRVRAFKRVTAFASCTTLSTL